MSQTPGPHTGVDLAAIEAAERTLKGAIVETPFAHSRTLSGPVERVRPRQIGVRSEGRFPQQSRAPEAHRAALVIEGGQGRGLDARPHRRPQTSSRRSTSSSTRQEPVRISIRLSGRDQLGAG